MIGREGAIPPLVLLLRSGVDKIQRNSAVTLKNLSTSNGMLPLVLVVLV